MKKKVFISIIILLSLVIISSPIFLVVESGVEGSSLAMPLQEDDSVNNSKQSLSNLEKAIVILTLLFLYYALRLRREAKESMLGIIRKVSFNPPEGLNPLEVAYLNNEGIRNKDITALIIYWAKNGFVEIREKDITSSAIFSSEGKFEYFITKLKDLKSEDEYEIFLFEKIFSFGQTNIKGEEEVEVSLLKDKFHGIMNEVNRRFIRKVNEDLNLYDKRFKKKHAVSVIFFVGLMFFWIYRLVTNSQDLLIILSGNILENPSSIFLIAILIAVIAGLSLSKGLYKFNNDVRALIEEIGGFKKFIQTAQEGSLDILVEDNPKYFYDILPYAVVLDLSDLWIDKFKELNFENPSWYYSKRRNSTIIARSVIKSLDNICEVMSSKPLS